MAAFLRSRVRGAKSLALLKALREGGWVTTSELTAAVGTHARGTGVLLTRLKAKGLVTSRARDGRSHHWRLTTLGCEVVK
jgi:DNA-binding transcriptional ArsR family regulator